MHRLHQVPTEQTPELLRLAVEMYHRDQLLRAGPEGHAMTEVARELGVPVEYVERAATRVRERYRRRQRRKEWVSRSVFFGLGLLTALSLTGRIPLSGPPSGSGMSAVPAMAMPLTPPVPQELYTPMGGGGTILGISPGHRIITAWPFGAWEVTPPEPPEPVPPPDEDE